MIGYGRFARIKGAACKCVSEADGNHLKIKTTLLDDTNAVHEGP